MGLDVALVRHGYPVLALDDHVGLGEARLEVTALEALGGSDVARGLRSVAVGVLVLVDQRRAVGHGLVQRHDGFEDLVLDIDQLQRGFRLKLGLGGHGGHRVAVVEDLVAGDHVLAQIIRVAGEVRARNRRHDAFGRRRTAYVHALDAGVGVGTAQHLAVQHVGQVEVGAECRPTGHLVDAVGTHRPGADRLEVYRFCHLMSP